jgi:hypothetical protein
MWRPCPCLRARQNSRIWPAHGSRVAVIVAQRGRGSNLSGDASAAANGCAVGAQAACAGHQDSKIAQIYEAPAPEGLMQHRLGIWRCSAPSAGLRLLARSDRAKERRNPPPAPSGGRWFGSCPGPTLRLLRVRHRRPAVDPDVPGARLAPSGLGALRHHSRGRDPGHGRRLRHRPALAVRRPHLGHPVAGVSYDPGGARGYVPAAGDGTITLQVRTPTRSGPQLTLRADGLIRHLTRTPATCNGP